MITITSLHDPPPSALNSGESDSDLRKQLGSVLNSVAEGHEPVTTSTEAREVSD